MGAIIVSITVVAMAGITLLGWRTVQKLGKARREIDNLDHELQQTLARTGQLRLLLLARDEKIRRLQSRLGAADRFDGLFGESQAKAD